MIFYRIKYKIINWMVKVLRSEGYTVHYNYPYSLSPSASPSPSPSEEPYEDQS